MPLTFPLRLAIFGPQGSGKGTQAKLMAEKYGIPMIYPGDLYRSHIASGSPIGVEAKAFVHAGKLAPDDLTNRMVKEKMAEPACGKGFIFDGYPRSNLQLVFMLRELPPLSAVIELALSDDEAIARLSGRRVCTGCGAVYHLTSAPPRVAQVCDECEGPLRIRHDDTEDAVRQRLAIYRQETEPLLTHFREQGKLIQIDARRTIEEIHAAMVGALETL